MACASLCNVIQDLNSHHRVHKEHRGQFYEHETMDELNRITETIIGAAIEAHRNLGPGLLESAYEACLAY